MMMGCSVPVSRDLAIVLAFFRRIYQGIVSQVRNICYYLQYLHLFITNTCLVCVHVLSYAHSFFSCKFPDVHFDKDLSTEDCVRNLDLFRSLCSQLICTSVLALKVEDLLYGSQAMKPNVVSLLAEIFHKCEIESLASENGVEKQTSKSDVDLRYIVANKENVVDNKSSSAPVLSSDKFKSVEHRSSRESFKSERSSSISGQINSSASDPTRQENSYAWKSQSDGQVNSNSRLSFKSPFHLDFTVDNDLQQPPLNGHLLKEGNDKENVLDKGKDKENPFSGILQRPVLAGDSRKHNLPANLAGGYGSSRATPRQEVPLLMRRNKQKQRTLDLEEWDMQQEEVEGNY